TLGGAVAAAAPLPAPLGAQLLSTARDAFSHALNVTIIICAGISALTAVMAFVLLRRLRAGPPAPGDV
ncbi:MAG: hypothetical protein JWM82_1179, partial [Myxococcales bacterium]|nr:hypothetical protein [Myxococcales bacterium]